MKKFYLLCLTLCVCLWANAQATDLVVDNQTPGWLSNKINYGDQQTVRNLKVTGYINQTDLSFIRELVVNRALNGIIDLGDANIVGSGSINDNEFNWFLYSTDWHEQELTLKKFICPKSITKILNNPLGLGLHHMDTLIIDIDCYAINYNMISSTSEDFTIGYVEFGNRVRQINEINGNFSINSIKLCDSLRYISENAFEDCFVDLSKINIKELPKLEYMGNMAFVNTSWGSTPVLSNGMTVPDTLYYPSIKTFYLSSFDYKKTTHIYLGETLTDLLYKPYSNNGFSWSPDLSKVAIHLRNTTPPNMVVETSGYNAEYVTFYVPMGTKTAYENYFNENYHQYGGRNWRNYSIIEENNSVTGISLDKSYITLKMGETSSIKATVPPINASDKTIEWLSTDNQIATVDNNGNVTALKTGEVWIRAISHENSEIMESCKVVVTVAQPVTSITLNESTIYLKRIGKTKQLVATILPENASNKNVTWTSATPAVCSVSDAGVVTAVGAGTGVVIATTVDGNMMAYCTVNVTPTDHTTITMGSNGIATFSDEDALNFTSVSGVKAYIASGFNPATGNLTMTRVYEVPAGEGLILKGATGSYDVPYEETSAYYANLLVGVPTATTVSPTDGSYTNFILANDELKGIGFYPLASAGKIGANKAYLQLPTSILPAASRSLRMVFEDEEEETTGINALNDKGQLRNDKAVYDLQGRRVSKPTRGLYIKDGKKIMVK